MLISIQFTTDLKDAAFVEERREALNHYCSTIVRMRAVLLCPELQEFLELGTHGVNISDATQPFASTVLSDPKFGVNDVGKAAP